MQNLLQQSGAQPQKQPRFVPLFIDHAFTGLYTQRSVLHDPSDLATARFYGGRPDALLDGLNVELTNRLTLQRRPGLVPFSTAIYPTAPNRAFSFPLTNGTIQVIVDTGSTGNIVLTSVANSISGTAIYTGTIPGGASNAYVGLKFTVSGFLSTSNNGVYTCTASTSTTITLSNSTASLETHAAVAVSTGAVYYDTQSGGVKVLLFAKAPGAGQTYFVAVAGVLYMGDGVDLFKYTPGNPNGTIWNFGGVAPGLPPSVVITESGSSAVAWQANTVFSTMGLLVDANGNVEQLISVNADGSNPSSRFGTSSSGAPTWNQSPGSTTTDNTITWINFGSISNWSSNQVYNNASVGGTLVNPCFVYDPTTNAIYGNANGGGTQGTSGSIRPPFVNVLGAFTNDNGGNNGHGIKWVCCGLPLPWQPTTSYTIFFAGGENPKGIIVEPISLPPITSQVIYAQIADNSGTSGSGGVNPPWPVLGSVGVQTQDNQLTWLSLGSATRAINTAYVAWVSGQSTFSVILDSNGNLQVCTVSGISSSTATGTITWATVYGSSTQDGTVTWVCVGKSLSWAASTIWYLPIGTSGVSFAPPESSEPYGSAEIIESSVVQAVINSGLSGGSPPSWGGIGTNTTDNTITWYGVATQSANSLAWTKGYQYAYSFKARSLTDVYSPFPLGGGLVPPGLTNALGIPIGSETGLVTTASPVFTITGGNIGAVNTVSGLGSTDLQFDTIVIWRTADGGSDLFELTEIPAPAPIGGAAQPWSFQDYLPDLPTSQFPGLNNLIEAPIDDQNDPPPAGFLPMAYNFQRIWGSVGDVIFFSGGPDVLTGNPDEAYNPADEIPFLTNVIRAIKTSQGLIVFLTNSIEIIAGGPLTSSFYSVTLAPGIGLGNYNAADVYAGELYFLSVDSQFKILSPSLQVSNPGFAIGDHLVNYNPMTAYVAVQQAGLDACIMVADGSTGWYRLNPRQVPGGANGPEPIWSPFATITNGCHMVQSVEIAPGVKKLLVGAIIPNQEILQRDLSVYTDNGTAYDAYFVMGSIVLAHPGQLAILRFIEADFSGVSYKPVISFLLNEISGTFKPFTLNPVFDPPSLYGDTITPTSYSPNRYYFSGTGSLSRCRHLQIRVDFGMDSSPDEMYNLTIFGRLMVEL